MKNGKSKEDSILYTMWVLFKLCLKLFLIPIVLVLLFLAW